MPVISLTNWSAELDTKLNDGTIIVTALLKAKDRLPEFATGVKRDQVKDSNGKITSPELFEHRFAVLPKKKVVLDPTVGGWTANILSKGRVTYVICMSEKHRLLFEAPTLVPDEDELPEVSDDDSDVDVDDVDAVDADDVDADEDTKPVPAADAAPVPQEPPQLLQQSLEELHLLFKTQPPAKVKRSERLETTVA